PALTPGSLSPPPAALRRLRQLFPAPWRSRRRDLNADSANGYGRHPPAARDRLRGLAANSPRRFGQVATSWFGRPNPLPGLALGHGSSRPRWPKRWPRTPLG